MKILLAHNYYRSSAPSGENVVFSNERDLLDNSENEIFSFERHSDDVDESTLQSKVRLAMECAWSNETYHSLSNLLIKVRPDIAHFHNTFPLISPSAYAACRDNGVPVIQTLHNYRLICPGALLLRDGRPCEDCVGTTLLPSLRHQCYRKSLPATGALVWMLLRNRWHKTYKTLVNRYIALTQFAADRFVAGGLPKDRIVIKPNFIDDDSPPGAGEGRYAVYVGRLGVEKGVNTLLSAWQHLPTIPLKILGEGPARVELERIVDTHRLPVEFLGFCDRLTTKRIVSKAAVQIVPSECYEGFPMVIVEAYACGTPVVSSRIGSLNEIVEEGVTGLKFRPGDATDLSEKISTLWNNEDLRLFLRQKVRERFDMEYSGKTNYKALMTIYRSAIDDNT